MRLMSVHWVRQIVSHEWSLTGGLRLGFFLRIQSILKINEVCRANLNAGKRIFKCQPFLHKVY